MSHWLSFGMNHHGTMKYDFAVMPCSAKKLPTPAPARWLYSRSPLFSLNLRFASANAPQLLVLSGKYGLIGVDQVIEPYDFLLEPSPEFLKLVTTQIKTLRLNKLRGVVLGSKRYKDVLRQCLKGGTYVGDGLSFVQYSKVLVREPLPELHPPRPTWPFAWILELVWNEKKVAQMSLLKELRARSCDEATITAQMSRANSCPLFERRGSFLHYRYDPA